LAELYAEMKQAARINPMFVVKDINSFDRKFVELPANKCSANLAQKDAAGTK